MSAHNCDGAHGPCPHCAAIEAEHVRQIAALRAHHDGTCDDHGALVAMTEAYRIKRGHVDEVKAERDAIKAERDALRDKYERLRAGLEGIANRWAVAAFDAGAAARSTLAAVDKGEKGERG